MDEAYRKRAGALADKYNLVRLPVAPKRVGDDIYPSPQREAYEEVVLCSFVRIDTFTPAMGKQDISQTLEADAVPAIEALPDPRVDDPNEYLLRVTDTSDTEPIVGYFEASHLDIGYVFGQQLGDPWAVYHYDESYFDTTFEAILTKLSLFGPNGENRLEQVREFREQFEEMPE